MGCTEAKSNVIIEVAYCGSCGWSIPAKNLCDAIQKQLPSALIDCRPENEYTGALKVTLITDQKQKKQVYKGNKDDTAANLEKIVKDIVDSYKKT